MRIGMSLRGHGYHLAPGGIPTSPPMPTSESQVCAANVLERQLCPEETGQMLRETGAHTPEGGGESWQDHVQA